MSDAAATLDAVSPEPPGALVAAHAAYARHAWLEAYEQFVAAEAAAGPGGLSGGDLEGLAGAAFFVGRPDEVIAAKERAFHAYQAAGDVAMAGAAAVKVAREYAFKGDTSIASAWVRRAEKVLQDQPESFAHGELALAHGAAAQASGDIDAAIAFVQEAARIGAATGNRDLEAQANITLGAIKVAMGKVADGFTLLEEATFAAVNGELSPYITGVSYCRMISVCRDGPQYKRAC